MYYKILKVLQRYRTSIDYVSSHVIFPLSSIRDLFLSVCPACPHVMAQPFHQVTPPSAWPTQCSASNGSPSPSSRCVPPGAKPSQCAAGTCCKQPAALCPKPHATGPCAESSPFHHPNWRISSRDGSQSHIGTSKRPQRSRSVEAARSPCRPRSPPCRQQWNGHRALPTKAKERSPRYIAAHPQGIRNSSWVALFGWLQICQKFRPAIKTHGSAVALLDSLPGYQAPLSIGCFGINISTLLPWLPGRSCHDGCWVLLFWTTAVTILMLHQPTKNPVLAMLFPDLFFVIYS